MKQVTQLSVGLPNSPGSLAHMSDMLRAADVNIEALFCTEGPQFTTVHTVVDDPETAKMVLQKIGPVHSAAILSIEVTNKPGTIAAIARKCAGGGINIKHIYATTIGKSAAVYLETEDIEKTKKVLK